jgi:hypothetical protein
MVDQAVRRRSSCCDRHVERFDGQAGLKMVGQRPANDLATEGIENDRQYQAAKSYNYFRR